MFGDILTVAIKDITFKFIKVLHVLVNMKSIIKSLAYSLLLVFVFSCDTDHKTEFYRIQRDDTSGYEAFIRKYPSSSFVPYARERIKTAKDEQRLREEQERLEAEARCLESQYGKNSLSNGAQPYSRWYGANQYYDDYTAHSEIRVKAPYNSDVIANVRYNNMNGSVAGYNIKAGNSATIYLRNGSYYQTFFYYGKGWFPDKQMNGKFRGGFLKNEAFSKDVSPSYLENQILSYELTMQGNGNFQTSTSNEGEMF